LEYLIKEGAVIRNAWYSDLVIQLGKIAVTLYL
jgi:hypothetical protein